MNETDLVAILASHGINTRRRGGNLMASCPGGTHPDRKPSWGISVAKPHFHGCFSCGFKGTLRTLLIHLGMSPSQARIVSEEESVEIKPSDLRLLLKAQRKEEAKSFEADELFLYYPTQRSDTYFRLIRGISFRTVRACHLMHDVKENRVLFPWFEGDKLVGLTGRTLSLREAKNGNKMKSYLQGVAKRNHLYLPQRKITPEPLIVVEGEGDALKVYDSGFKNVAAVAGRLSDRQVNLMLNSPATEILGFGDDDATGQRLNRELEEKLGGVKVYREVRYDRVRSNYPDTKLDPGKLSRKEVQELIKHSVIFPSWRKVSGQ